MPTAMQKAELMIADAFRPERKERAATILSGHRIKMLVQAGRYTFPEACRLLEIQRGQVAEAYKWLDADNARMNRAYGTELYGLTAGDLFMKAFFSDEEACLSDNVVQFAVSAA